MASLVARAASSLLRRTVKPGLAAAASLEDATKILSARLPFFQTGRAGALRFDRIEGEGFVARSGDAHATMLYFHGGAYFAGSPAIQRPILRAFAAKGFDVFAPAYRLAPRFPFPAAIEDARRAYDLLRETRDGPVVVAGDSAGGGLALALMISLRDAGESLPAAAALFSPWTDLAVNGASARENEERDALFTRRMLKIAARAYLAGAEAKTPLASPLYADFSGLTPIIIHASDDELLRDDATRLVERASAARVEARLRLWPGVPHGWQLATPYMREARESLNEAAAFLLERTPQANSPPFREFAE